MGSLSLPDSGPIYLDTNSFIYSVERVEPYRSLLEPVWRRARAGEFSITSSELTIHEVLVKPLREGNKALELLFRSLFDANDVSLVPATRELWDDAAHIRAETRLTTPDALHAATALHAECTLFITNDRDFRDVQGLPVVIMADVLVA